MAIHGSVPVFFGFGTWKGVENTQIRLFYNSIEHLTGSNFLLRSALLNSARIRCAYIPWIEEHGILPNVKKDPIKAKVAMCSPKGFLTSVAIRSRRQLSTGWRVVNDMIWGMTESSSPPQMILSISQPQPVWTEVYFFAFCKCNYP